MKRKIIGCCVSTRGQDMASKLKPRLRVQRKTSKEGEQHVPRPWGRRERVLEVREGVARAPQVRRSRVQSSVSLAGSLRTGRTLESFLKVTTCL